MDNQIQYQKSVQKPNNLLYIVYEPIRSVKLRFCKLILYTMLTNAKPTNIPLSVPEDTCAVPVLPATVILLFLKTKFAVPPVSVVTESIPFFNKKKQPV